MVSGLFAEMPLSDALGVKTGVWTVTFASGTDPADAVRFEVDMMRSDSSKVGMSRAMKGSEVSTTGTRLKLTCVCENGGVM